MGKMENVDLGCVGYSKLLDCVDGESRGKFRAARALIQGDPSSPFLFT